MSPVMPRAAGLALGLLGAFFVIAGPVAAHAEFESSVPRDGAIVSGSPATVAATFSEGLASGSKIELRDASDAIVATGRIDPADDTRMVITPPALAPGAYTVRWTSIAEDGDLLRGTFRFTVAAAPASPSGSPPPAPSAAAGPPSASANTTLSASPSPTATPSPAASSSDVVVPILAAVIVLVVLGAVLLGRRARTPR
ncbi:MAG: copper resistance protein CopC [Chloroflexota bacterium]